VELAQAGAGAALVVLDDAERQHRVHGAVADRRALGIGEREAGARRVAPRCRQRVGAEVEADDPIAEAVQMRDPLAGAAARVDDDAARRQVPAQDRRDELVLRFVDGLAALEPPARLTPLRGAEERPA
jgi:hypothetical protein